MHAGFLRNLGKSHAGAVIDVVGQIFPEIAKRIVGMHGGVLTVESALGAGSTFCMTVPIRVREGKEAA